MNREIKFRLWRPYDQDQKMIYPRFISNELAQSELSFLMQYTNLKDKNGTEIYEGDLIDFGNTELKEVRWSIDGGCWMVGSLILSASCEHREVVGNIYENK
jgi:hypothetical protein